MLLSAETAGSVKARPPRFRLPRSWLWHIHFSVVTLRRSEQRVQHVVWFREILDRKTAEASGVRLALPRRLLCYWRLASALRWTSRLTYPRRRDQLRSCQVDRRGLVQKVSLQETLAILQERLKGIYDHLVPPFTVKACIEGSRLADQAHSGHSVTSKPSPFSDVLRTDLADRSWGAAVSLIKSDNNLRPEPDRERTLPCIRRTHFGPPDY